MKNFIVFMFLTAHILLFSRQANSSGAMVNIQARGSYKTFEQCMKSNNNDITQCIQLFKETVTLYKEAIKLDSSNKEFQDTLLQLVNSMNDIAETFYAAAESKENKEPTDSNKYFVKAAICFEQLTILYPSKRELIDLLNKANFKAKYTEVERDVLKLKNNENIVEYIKILVNLKKSFDEFTLSYGENKSIKDKITTILTDFESNINLRFEESIKTENNKNIASLIYLVDCEANILNIDKKNEFQDHYSKMESKTVQIIENYIDTLNGLLKKSDIEFYKGNFPEADRVYSELLTQVEYYPDSSLFSLDPKNQIKKTINSFNIATFKTEIAKGLNIKAKFKTKYTEVEGYALKLRNNENIIECLKILSNLKKSFDDFTITFGGNKSLSDKIAIILTDFESNINLIFEKSIKIQKSKDITSLIYLVDCEANILNIDKKNEFQNHYNKMEGQTVQIIENFIDTLNGLLKKADIEFNNGNYAEADRIYLESLTQVEYYPDSSLFSLDPQNQIKKTINRFNIATFKTEVYQRKEPAKNTALFLNLISKGESWFNDKHWLNAYKLLIEATDIANQTNKISIKGEQLATLLIKIQEKIVLSITHCVDDYKAQMKNADTEFNKNNFTEAEKLYSNLLKNLELFPNFDKASADIKNQIKNQIKDFDIIALKIIVEKKLESANKTPVFLDLVSKGSKYLNNKEWLDAIKAFDDATVFLKSNNVVADKGENLNILVDKLRKKILELKPDEITSEDLADLRYKPISYEQWLENAKDGKFSENHVKLSGNVQQMVGGIIILKNYVPKLDFSLGIFIGTEMNSAGLVFSQKRFFKVDSSISCIGQFRDIEKFTAGLGAEIQIPVFNVIWEKK